MITGRSSVLTSTSLIETDNGDVVRTKYQLRVNVKFGCVGLFRATWTPGFDWNGCGSFVTLNVAGWQPPPTADSQRRHTEHTKLSPRRRREKSSSSAGSNACATNDIGTVLTRCNSGPSVDCTAGRTRAAVGGNVGIGMLTSLAGSEDGSPFMSSSCIRSLGDSWPLTRSCNVSGNWITNNR